MHAGCRRRHRGSTHLVWFDTVMSPRPSSLLSMCRTAGALWIVVLFMKFRVSLQTSETVVSTTTRPNCVVGDSKMSDTSARSSMAALRQGQWHFCSESRDSHFAL